MTDVFFSYSSKDRDRVRPFHEALTALDFQVFWDQEVPAGTDWDTWIREQLTKSRAAVVFWSAESVASDNVRHEATVAKQDGKLVPVMLDDLRVDQFPMGLFNTQAARLMDWTGDPDDPEWQKLIGEIQSKAMPAWVGRLLAYKDEELRTERKKRESAVASGDAARNELEKEIGSIDDLRRARDAATADAERSRAEVDGVKTALAESKTKADDLAARLSAAETAAAKQGATAKNRAPAWLLTASSLVSLVAGAAAVYIFQVVPNQQLADNASAKIELAKTEASATIDRLRAEKSEAEERADRLKAEADKARAESDKARTERIAAEEQAAKLLRETRQEISGSLAKNEQAGKNTQPDTENLSLSEQTVVLNGICQDLNYDKCGINPFCQWKRPEDKCQTLYSDVRAITPYSLQIILVQENCRAYSQAQCFVRSSKCRWTNRESCVPRLSATREKK